MDLNNFLSTVSYLNLIFENTLSTLFNFEEYYIIITGAGIEAAPRTVL